MRMMISLICNCLLVTIFIGMVVAVPVPTTQSPPRWHAPCQGDNPVAAIEDISWEDAALPPIANHTHYLDLAILSREAAQAAHELKMKYADERFRNEEHIAFLQQFHLNGMPEVKEYNPNLAVEPVSSMHDAVDRFARAAVFLEQTRIDEIKFEYDHRSFQREIQILEERIYGFLCKLQIALRYHSQDMAKAVDDSVMDSTYRSITVTSHRYMRDFIIVRDVHAVLDYTNTEFTMLYDNHKPQQL